MNMAISWLLDDVHGVAGEYILGCLLKQHHHKEVPAASWSSVRKILDNLILLDDVCMDGDTWSGVRHLVTLPKTPSITLSHNIMHMHTCVHACMHTYIITI